MVRTSSDGVDGGAEAIAKQRGFTLVRPDEGWFPGLEKLREELAGHQWIFGKTPKFKVSIFTTTALVVSKDYFDALSTSLFHRRWPFCHIPVLIP